MEVIHNRDFRWTELQMSAFPAIPRFSTAYSSFINNFYITFCDIKFVYYLISFIPAVCYNL